MKPQIVGNTWVYGKVIPEWYIARNGWDRDYTTHLESLGYKVSQSQGKPEAA